MLSHSTVKNATAALCCIFFLCGYSDYTFNTIWVPKAICLQYHINHIFLWNFPLYHILPQQRSVVLFCFSVAYPIVSSIPHGYNRLNIYNTKKLYIIVVLSVESYFAIKVPQQQSVVYSMFLFRYHMGTTGFTFKIPHKFMWYLFIRVVYSVCFFFHNTT